MASKSYYLLLILGLFTGLVNAQDVDLLGRRNVITSAVPFLNITPDSRSGALGDAGVAIPVDANAMHWNPAKLAYMENKVGLSVSYTPWLRNLVPDIDLSYVSGQFKVDDVSAFGVALRYFTLGEINFTDRNNQDLGTFNPNEFSLDGAYSRKLSDDFSVGIALKFIYSNLSGNLPLEGGAETKPGIAFAGDASVYYNKEDKDLGDYKIDWAVGVNISNIGNRISYAEDDISSFIPTNMKLGGYFNFHIDEYNEVALIVDINKLLIPTPPVYETDSQGIALRNPDGSLVLAAGDDPDVGVVEGMIQSFSDAPGGFTEELREINPSLGLEYWYNKQFAVRLGYFYEHPTKGARQYLTAGFGIKYNILGFDFAYLAPVFGDNQVQNSPLANTLRFTLSFDFSKSNKDS